MSVDAVVFFRISDPIQAVTNVNDPFYSTRLLAQTTLRNVLGMKTLSEMLSDRDGIAALTQKTLDEGTEAWGVKVERVEMKVARLVTFLCTRIAGSAIARNAQSSHGGGGPRVATSQSAGDQSARGGDGEWMTTRCDGVCRRATRYNERTKC